MNLHLEQPPMFKFIGCVAIAFGAIALFVALFFLVAWCSQ
jgi:hypothetical protein